MTFTTWRICSFSGQLGGADSAPVAAAGPFFSVITAMAAMIGVGGSATITKVAGAGDWKENYVGQLDVFCKEAAKRLAQEA